MPGRASEPREYTSQFRSVAEVKSTHTNNGKRTRLVEGQRSVCVLQKDNARAANLANELIVVILNVNMLVGSLVEGVERI